MKKLGIALMVSLLGAGFVACDDKLSNGEACTKGDECASGFCSDDKKCADDVNADKLKDGEACTKGEECASGFCSDDKKCAAKPADDKLKDGEACTKGEECASGFCSDDKKCADDVNADKLKDGEACTKGDECASGFCSDDKKCAAKPADDKLKDGEACTKGEECASGFCSDDKKCAAKPADAEVPKDGEACDKMSIECNGKNLVECAEDENAPGELVWKVTACSDACLDLDDAEPACYTACAEAGKSRVICDPDSGEDGDSLKASIELTCTEVSGGKYELVSKRTECEGMYTCDTATGKCETPSETDPGKGIGEDCQVAGDCLSSYCDETTKKCAERPSDLKENGAACADANECLSGYCANSVCAEVPVVKVACKLKADCATDEICGAEYVCIAAEGKAGLGDACAETADCASELACLKEKCVLEAFEFQGETCQVEESECFGEALVTCEQDLWDTENMSLVYNVLACPEKGNVCTEYEGKARCYEPCTEANATRVLCDTENVNGNDESLGKVTYTCKDVDGKLLFVPTATEECGGSATCDMYDGTARCL